MTRTARFLPLPAVVAWAITLQLPILDSANTRGPRIVVTSLGGNPFDLAEAEPTFLMAWIGVLICAVSVWFLRSLTRWSVLTLVVAVLLGVLLVSLLVDPPSLSWTGADIQGRSTGGHEVGKPAAGALVWTLGIGALFAASICGFRGERRHEDDRVSDPTVASPG